MSTPHAPRRWVFFIVLLAAIGCKKTDEMVPYEPRTAPQMQKAGPMQVKLEPSAPLEAVANCEGKVDRKIRSDRGEGTFRGVQVGDGTKVVVRHGDKTDYFAVENEALAYFLVAHKKEPLRIEYDVLERCIAQAGGYIRVLRLTAATAASLTFGDWNAQVTSDPSKLRAAKEAFQKYVDAPFAK